MSIVPKKKDNSYISPNLQLDLSKKDYAKYHDQGRKICEENEFMSLLMQAGENNAIQTLFRDYAKTGMDTKTLCMYLKLYAHVDENYRSSLNPYQKICLISNLIRNKQSRSFIVQKTQDFLEN